MRSFLGCSLLQTLSQAFGPHLLRGKQHPIFDESQRKPTNGEKGFDLMIRTVEVSLKVSFLPKNRKYSKLFCKQSGSFQLFQNRMRESQICISLTWESMDFHQPQYHSKNTKELLSRVIFSFGASDNNRKQTCYTEPDQINSQPPRARTWSSLQRGWRGAFKRIPFNFQREGPKSTRLDTSIQFRPAPACTCLHLPARVEKINSTRCLWQSTCREWRSGSFL